MVCAQRQSTRHSVPLLRRPRHPGSILQKQGMNLVAHPPLFDRYLPTYFENLLPGRDDRHSLYLVCLREHFAFSTGGRLVGQRDATLGQVQGSDSTFVSANHELECSGTLVAIAFDWNGGKECGLPVCRLDEA